MKQTGTCPKCQARRIVHLVAVADAGEWSGRGSGNLAVRSGAHPVARQVLLRRRIEKGVFGGDSEEYDLTGDVEAYACADCGFFEEYLKDPPRIPWNEIAHVAAWTPPKGQGGPFR